MSRSSLERYAAELTEALEFRDVPDEAIQEIVREVNSHVVDSGEDPVAAFGRPSDYADNFAPTFRKVWFWTLIAASVTLASSGAYFLISGVFGLQSADITLWELPPVARISIGVVGIAAFFTLIFTAGARANRRARAWHI